MHGLIFNSFRDYLTTSHPVGIDQVLASEPAYLISEAYPDDRFTALLERACEATGLDREALLCDFGIFAAENTLTSTPSIECVSTPKRSGPSAKRTMRSGGY